MTNKINIYKSCMCCRKIKNENMFYNNSVKLDYKERKLAENPDYKITKQKICKECVNTTVKHERKIKNPKRWTDWSEEDKQKYNMDKEMLEWMYGVKDEHKYFHDDLDYPTQED